MFLTGVEINLPSTLSGEVEESKIGTIKVSFWECRATLPYEKSAQSRNLFSLKSRMPKLRIASILKDPENSQRPFSKVKGLKP